MKNTPSTFHCADAIAALIANPTARSAVIYLNAKTIVRATWHNKPSAKNRGETVVVTFGAPNYLEREFIKQCKKAGEPFPLKKIQFKLWPKKKGAACK